MSYDLIHFVFSFKYRRQKPPEACAWLEEEIRKLCIKYGGDPHAVAIHGFDHIHILVDLKSTVAKADFMRNVKSRSAYLARIKYHWTGPLWQKRYLYRSIGSAGTTRTKKYIKRFVKEDRQRKHTFTSHLMQVWGSPYWQTSPKEDQEWPF